MSDLDDDDFDVEGMMEGMEEEMAAAGDAGVGSRGVTHDATEDEEEEEEERGVVAAAGHNNNTLAVPGQLTPLLGSPTGPATAGGSGSSAAGAAAAKPKVKKRKPAVAKSPAGSAGGDDDEERAAKMARAMSSGSLAQSAAAAAEAEAKAKAWQSRLSSSDRARFAVYESTHFSKDALRRVLASLLAPLPAGQGSGAGALKILPPLVVASMGAVAKGVLGEIIEEALRVQQQQHWIAQQQQLTRQSTSSSASTAPPPASVAASPGALQPAAIVEAYRRLVAAGRIPSRVTAPTTSTGNGASSLHNPIAGANAAAAAAIQEQQSILQQQQQQIGSTPGLASTLPKAKRNRAWRR